MSFGTSAFFCTSVISIYITNAYDVKIPSFELLGYVLWHVSWLRYKTCDDRYFFAHYHPLPPPFPPLYVSDVRPSI